MQTLAAQHVDVSHPLYPPQIFLFWSLFDIHEQKELECFLVSYPCFPVQTVLPDPIWYHTWDKENLPLITSLPLWTCDELAQGYVLPITCTHFWLQYQDEYHSLLDMLHKVYSSPNSSYLLDPCDIGAHVLLEECYSKEDTVPPSPEDALDYLLDAAINHFRYSAHDMFGAVQLFSDDLTPPEHFFQPQLCAIATWCTRPRSQSKCQSLHIIALHPVNQGPLKPIHWTVDFKLDWVARNVNQKTSIFASKLTSFEGFQKHKDLQNGWSSHLFIIL